MDCKISSTKLACIVAYLLFACFFQLLMANEEAKLNDELNVIQLPEANSEALDGVNQVFVTRYALGASRLPHQLCICYMRLKVSREPLFRLRISITNLSCFKPMTTPLNQSFRTYTVMNQVQPNVDTKITPVVIGLTRAIGPRTSNRVRLIWNTGRVVDVRMVPSKGDDH
ncbi:uncharacterized protein LOC107024761 [Solanum pennellii]|uniref:Uncharacterized protein LOC107024761 n=1 Tax=Solanum pennellii TaxID=28526 RepID=A0ABM1VEE4_SOLPN|nr:uncharacterized protein LOC107024761 [Solanum pennellii]